MSAITSGPGNRPDSQLKRGRSIFLFLAVENRSFALGMRLQSRNRSQADLLSRSSAHFTRLGFGLPLQGNLQLDFGLDI